MLQFDDALELCSYITLEKTTFGDMVWRQSAKPLACGEKKGQYIKELVIRGPVLNVMWRAVIGKQSKSWFCDAAQHKALIIFQYSFYTIAICQR